MAGMKVLGIDPGLGRVGFGLIETSDPRQMAPLVWGTIVTDKHQSDAARLQEIHQDLGDIITQYRPDVASVERMFYFRNATTVIPVAQARGVIILLLHAFGVPYAEYTPMQVKQAVTGSGRAKKNEIQDMLVPLLAMRTRPTPDDAADGLALAVCHHLHVGRQAQQTLALSAPTA